MVKLHNTEKDDLKLINQFTKRALTADEVYTFTVTLCDNDIDRDYEAFTKEALTELGKLFVGKTGIFDHNPKSENQTARIYKTWCEKDESKKTAFGEDYYALKAKAYMMKTAKNESLIEEIEGGIKKEVSVSCKMNKTVCSICHKEFRHGLCEHQKGNTYSGKLCYGILSQAQDAYEWSFVAVPAQRNAGVTKSFIKEENMDNALNIIKAAKGETVLNKEQTEYLKSYIEQLEEYKEEAIFYKKSLKGEIEKYALIVMPMAAQSEDFFGTFENMSIKQLENICQGLKKQAQNILPPTVQLQSIKENRGQDNRPYTI